MATYIKTLKEDNGDITYPQTKAGAVLLNNGSDLETELSQYVTAEDIASTSALTPPVQTNMIANGAVTTGKIANASVTSDKIDWTTLGYKHTRASTDITVGTSTTTLLSFQLTAGTWLLIGTSDFNHNNTAIGDSFIGFQNLTSNGRIGSEFYFHEVNNGTYWFVETAHEVVTLTGAANIGLVAKKGQGTLSAKRRSFTAIRIG